MVKAGLNPGRLVPEPVLSTALLHCVCQEGRHMVSHLYPWPPMCVQQAVPESRKRTLSGGAGNHPWQILDTDKQADPGRSKQGMQEAEDPRSLPSRTGSPRECPGSLSDRAGCVPQKQAHH